MVGIPTTMLVCLDCHHPHTVSQFVTCKENKHQHVKIIQNLIKSHMFAAISSLEHLWTFGRLRPKHLRRTGPPMAGPINKPADMPICMGARVRAEFRGCDMSVTYIPGDEAVASPDWPGLELESHHLKKNTVNQLLEIIIVPFSIGMWKNTRGQAGVSKLFLISAGLVMVSL